MSFLYKFSKAIFAVAVAGAISASAFSEGEDYVKLEKPLSVGQNTLVKIFSYACPFCYKYDKSVTPKVVEKIPGLKYEPFHLKTKGDYGELCSKVFVLENGKISRSGSASEIFLKSAGSQKFAFNAKVLEIKKRDAIFVASVLINRQICEVVLSSAEASGLRAGDTVVVSTKAFGVNLVKA